MQPDETEPVAPLAHGADSAGAGAGQDTRRRRAAAGREAAVDSRERAVDDREQAVGLREDDAERREGEVLERDHAAEVREGVVVGLVADLKADLDPDAVEILTDNQASAGSDRARAGDDRRLSAGDRSHAQADRKAAAQDRKLVVDERESALFDDLTGVLRRGPGFHQMGRELARVQRSGEPLVLGFVDVDGLKGVNDSQGHLAGDALLRSAAAALRDNLRPYDTVLRYGGDEFVCALIGLDEAQVRARLAAVNAISALSIRRRR